MEKKEILNIFEIMLNSFFLIYFNPFLENCFDLVLYEQYLILFCFV
jgi:hypothetical protein